MKKYIFLCLVTVLCGILKVNGQEDFNERARRYVQQYSSLAIAEQRRSGIPAAITLGQGILETEAGISELMTKANNHFGIKCKNGWNGEIFLHTDDAPNEKFKKYKCAQDSYRDHSDHLKNNARYAPLFKLSETDYAAWAKCLKKCGYATNPQYAQRLIKIIEDYKLQEYTYNALDNNTFGNYPIVPVAYKTPAPDSEERSLAKADLVVIKSEAENGFDGIVADTPKTSKNTSSAAASPAPADNIAASTLTVNGLKAFFASKGEDLHPAAEKYNIPYQQLLLFNDLTDGAVPFDMNIYLERKLTSGTHPVHIITEGESLLAIAQAESVQLQSLLSLNLLNGNEEPVTGSILELQKPASQKPEVKIRQMAAHETNAIIVGNDTAHTPADMVAIDRGSIRPQGDTIKTAEPKTIPASIPAPTPVAVKLPSPQPEIEKPIVHTIPVKRAQYEMTDEEIQEESTRRVEFAKLKSELDKIVYADDSKLAGQNIVAPTPIHAAATTAPKKEVPSPIANSGNKYYTVKKGDTAFSIAKKNNITVDELQEWNGIKNGAVKVGQNLKVSE